MTTFEAGFNPGQFHNIYEGAQQAWLVKVYVQHGYFQYEVGSVEQAMAHGEAIMSKRVYRRSTPAGDVEFLHCYKVKVTGPGLESEYLDEFMRT